MICSSVNRFFMSNLLDGGIGLQSHVLLNSGGGVAFALLTSAIKCLKFSIAAEIVQMWFNLVRFRAE